MNSLYSVATAISVDLLLSRMGLLGRFQKKLHTRIFSKFQPPQRKQCVGLSLDHLGGWFEIH